MLKPDFNNVLFHKDKGRGVKHEIKAYKFSDSLNLPPQEGRQLQDRAKELFPGPGSYMPHSIEVTTFGQTAPKYSLPTAGQVVIQNHDN